ncbi:hypothetical protein SAMN02910370_02857 [Lachnospiraceae bacterium XPB1003]|nr:hypothetical protein SAMN02910370_02857 [Lachnospiraceae bacterium XPB1003]
MLISMGISLGIDMEDPKECYMKSKDPIALIRGEATLEEIGLRNQWLQFEPSRR